MMKNYIFTLALLSPTIVFAENNEHREHDAHQHGHAQLSVILEKNALSIMLESPAMNVFGFEHKPKNEEQNKSVLLAIKDLEKPEQLLQINKSAKCTLAKVDVHNPFMTKKDHEHEKKHEEGHEDSYKESAHTDVDIEISFTCQKPSNLTKIDLSSLFKRFPNFEDIDAQKIVNGQQSADELSKKQPVFILNK